jgi:hypothetical protein
MKQPLGLLLLDAVCAGISRNITKNAPGHDVFHESAHTPAMKPEQAITPPQPEIAPVIEHGFGLGHSLYPHLPRMMGA